MHRLGQIHPHIPFKAVGLDICAPVSTLFILKLHVMYLQWFQFPIECITASAVVDSVLLLAACSCSHAYRLAPNRPCMTLVLYSDKNCRSPRTDLRTRDKVANFQYWLRYACRCHSDTKGESRHDSAFLITAGMYILCTKWPITRIYIYIHIPMLQHS